ncbi:MAG: large subunit ribosomal protein [Microbacteriaceae bacterium]|nr:large subunit ribosomal protein [Microbacteriaceae bacterium]
MAVGTKGLAPTELDAFDESRLKDELRRAKEELFNLRFQSATGQLEGHGRLGAVKRDIARIYTVLRERELGIRATPAPVETPTPAAKRARGRKAEVSDDTAKKADAAESTAPKAETTEATADAPAAEASDTAAATSGTSTEETN